MPSRTWGAEGVPADLVDALARLRDELGVPEAFPDDALAEADRLASDPPDFADHRDATDIPFVTIDPASSMDLDQAVHIERTATGFLVHYAIADVGAWVRPGGAIDAEAHRRGQTYYAPNAKSPLHPPHLSESAASLLADGRARPAMLWQLDLDAAGNLVGTQLTRAMVTNREKLSYEGVQKALDDGSAGESLQLLREVGTLRQGTEAARGGVSLNLPEQEVVAEDDHWRLEFRALLPVENWNAQISLLTGIAAAQLMIGAKVGVLRTLPPTDKASLNKLRHVATSLGIRWPGGMSYPDFVRSLDPAKSRHLAMMTACTALFRGAGYTAFDGRLPDGNLTHAALATPYAHTTAPLRRLVDRYVLEVCHSIANGSAIPAWARQALAALPDEMATSDARAKKFERGVVDLVEVLVLRDRVGESFDGVVTSLDPKRRIGSVQIADPAVEGQASGLARNSLGQQVQVTLESADLDQGRIELSGRVDR